MGHAVLYRWKLRQGKEEDFVAAWGRLADVLCNECGAIGSRLHKSDDGTYLAYSYWPSRKAWELAQTLKPKSAARALMAAAIEERYPETHLELLDERMGDVPEDAVPEEDVPRDAAPEGASPEDAGPAEAGSEDADPEGAGAASG